MKRCPECDFLYEDDQTFCDMEGKTLVVEANPAFDKNSLTETIQPRSRSLWRQFVLLAIPLAFMGASIPVLNKYRHSASMVPDASWANSTQSPPEPTAEVVDLSGANLEPSLAERSASSPVSNLDSSDTTPVQEKTLPLPDSTDSSAEQFSLARTSQMNTRSPGLTNERTLVTRGIGRSLGNNRAKSGGIQILEVRPRRSTSYRLEPVRTSPQIHEVAKSKDSKIAVFLKKTGRVLKKPFQF